MSYVLFSGRAQEALQSLEHRISKSESFKTQVKPIINGHADPLHGVSDLPGALVLLLENNSTLELEAFADRPPALRPPLVVVGENLDPVTMRVAMQAGARDFLSSNCSEHELSESLAALLEETKGSGKTRQSQLISVVSASGGDGASVVALNLAALSAQDGQYKTALVDLDLQHAPLSHLLDLQPPRGILEALEMVDELDGVSLEAFFSSHSSELELMCALPSVEIALRDRLSDAMATLTEKVNLEYERVFVDLPGQLDAMSASVLEQSNQVLIVVQQSVKSLRNATRLFEILRHELAVSEKKIGLVLNRYDKKSMIGIADVKAAVWVDKLYTVANDFVSVSESIDFGVPLVQHRPGSPASRALHDMEQLLRPPADRDVAPVGMRQRLASMFGGQ